MIDQNPDTSELVRQLVAVIKSYTGFDLSLPHGDSTREAMKRVLDGKLRPNERY